MTSPLTIRFTGPETYTAATENDEHEGRLGEPYTFNGFNFVIEKRDSSKTANGENDRYLVWFESPSSLVNSYRANLKVEAVNEGATVFTLSFNGYSPEQGADYLNTLMRLYIIQGMEWKSRAADNTINFIEIQLGLVSDSLRLAENSMENFRLNNRFVDLTLEGTLVLERLEKFEGEKNVLGLQMQYYNYLLDYIESREDNETIISPSVMGVSDPVLVGLVNEFATLQQQRKQMVFMVKDNQDQVQLLDRQIEDARSALQENVSSAISQLKMTVSTVDGRIASVEQALGRLPGTERRLIGIQRKFDLNNSVYTYLLERRAEAGIAKASQITDNRIIDEAVPHNSTKIAPKEMKNYLVALLLGLMIPMALIVVLDLFNNKIIGRHDIEALTKAPIIGFISHSEYHLDVPVAEKPGSTLAESFRAVRTSLAFYTGQTKCPVIALSALPSAARARPSLR